MAWQLQDAKQRFSEVVRKALSEGPQWVTRHGRPVVVVAAVADYEAGGAHRSFKDVLLSGPDLDDLDLDRADAPAPEVAL